jgi:Flp pilus assembly protein TadG
VSRSAQRGRQRSLDRRRRYGRGQTVVEFALILPLFMLLLMAIIEFGFLFNSFLAINFASREASLVAAEAGTMGQADCLILDAIEKSVTAPSDAALITEVRIYRANRAGTMTGDINRYQRTGATTCTLPSGEMQVPYEPIGAPGYLPGDRCNRLAGCPANPTGVDQIGVEVSYAYGWHTPLGSVFGGSGGSTNLTNRNVMRMEPVL